MDVPAFQFVQERYEYGSRTHHTNMDFLDRVQVDDVKQMAAVVAVFAWHAATREGADAAMSRRGRWQTWRVRPSRSRRQVFCEANPAQVPLQDQQPAGSALRPAVMGPSGGVSTGHPLTTAAAFGDPAEGRQRVRRRRGLAACRRRARAGPLQPRRRSAGARVSRRKRARSRRSSARAGRRTRSTSTGISRVRRRLAGRRGSIPPSCPARCTPRSRCSSDGAR